MTDKQNVPVTSEPVANSPVTDAPAVDSVSEPKGKKSKVWLIVLIIVLILLCLGISAIVFFVRNMSTDTISDLSDTNEQVDEIDESTDTTNLSESSDLAGKWVDVYSESGQGSKNTKIFQIDRDNSNGWQIIYTFAGSSDTSTLSIDSTSPPLTYGTTVVDHVYENGEVSLDEDGPYYLTIATDDDSSWTIQIKQLMNDQILTNVLDDSTGEWADILSDEGIGSQNTEVFQISKDNSKGWEIVYTFQGSSDTSTLYIEYVVPELTYGTTVVEYVYEGGTFTFDETTTGSYYLRIGTDDNSSWTVEIRQLLD
ncbi:hypothetical protein K8R14_04150 [bacterium]|nr:hypothetical protein [bacterium]